MNPRRPAAIILGAAAAIALAALCWCGLYVRYKADDFWTASIVARLGFWKSQTWWYERWSGRYAYTFLIGIVELIGPRIVPPLVTMAIVAWIAATRWLVKTLPLAIIFVYAAAAGAPDVPQAILWQTGLLTYVVPIAGLTAWLATTIDRDSLRWYDVVVPFVLAGFSETNTIAQIILLAAVVIVFRKRSYGVALIVSAAALIVIALAPGNAVRLSLYPRHTLTWVATNAISGTAKFFFDEVTRSGLPLVTMFIAAMLLAPRVSRRLTTTLFIVTILVAGAAFAASHKALAVAPPGRTLIVPHVFLVAAIAAAGTWVPAPRAAVLLAAIAAAIPVFSAIELARNIPDTARFARAWDRLDADLGRSRGKPVVVAGAPGSVGTLAFITHDSRAWSNHCISDYYSLDGIASAPPGRLGSTKLLEDLPVYATEGPGRHDDHDVVRLRFASD